MTSTGACGLSIEVRRELKFGRLSGRYSAWLNIHEPARKGIRIANGCGNQATLERWPEYLDERRKYSDWLMYKQIGRLPPDANNSEAKVPLACM